MKKIVGVLVCVALALAVYFAVDSVLEIKTYDMDALSMLHQMPKDSVDVLFVGSSHVGMNIDNETLWENYGISSINLWAGMQPIWMSYYYAKESLHSQHPKVMLVDVFLCSSTIDYFSPQFALNNILPLRPGLDRVKAAFESYSTWQEAVEALWGLPFYHARYGELTAEDINRTPEYVPEKPQHVLYIPDTAIPLNLLDYNAITNELPLTSKNEKYLYSLINLCRSQNIPLVFLISPYEATEEDCMRLNTVERIAQEENIPVLNGLKIYQELGIDPATDFHDTGHMNIKGVKNYSSMLGAYLQDHYDLPDRRAQQDFIWNQYADENTSVMQTAYTLEQQFVGDGAFRYIDTGVRLFRQSSTNWTLRARLDLNAADGQVFFSCFDESDADNRRGLLVSKAENGQIKLLLGRAEETLLSAGDSGTTDLTIMKTHGKYTVYLDGERVADNLSLPCDPHEGALLIGCQERLPGGEKYNFSHGHVLNLEIYERVLDAQTIADWSPEALPEPQLPLGLLVEKPEPVYTLPEQFLGGGEGYDQGAYMDTDLRLLDEAGTRFTLLASVTPEHIDGDKVFFSCFSEEADHYRGILARQWDDESMNVVVGANYGVNIPIELGQPVKLAIIKDGSTYTVYANGEKLLDQTESRADTYDGTLLIGAQRDAEGNVFRMSRTRVNSLTVMSGVMDEADILAYDFADAPEPAKIVPTSVSYRMPTAFAGNGKSNSLDTGVMLYDVPAKDWTLQATVRTRQGTNAGVYFSCFSESGSYRGLMLRQNDENTISLFMGELATHTFDLTDQNRTLNLVVVKQGDTYRVYANGAFCEEIEIPCTRYTGTLLVGCQADAEGELFRFSNARVDALELWDGAMEEEEALKRSAQQGAGSRFD